MFFIGPGQLGEKNQWKVSEIISVIIENTECSSHEEECFHHKYSVKIQKKKQDDAVQKSFSRDWSVICTACSRTIYQNFGLICKKKSIKSN